MIQLYRVDKWHAELIIINSRQLLSAHNFAAKQIKRLCKFSCRPYIYRYSCTVSNACLIRKRLSTRGSDIKENVKERNSCSKHTKRCLLIFKSWKYESKMFVIKTMQTPPTKFWKWRSLLKLYLNSSVVLFPIYTYFLVLLHLLCSIVSSLTYRPTVLISVYWVLIVFIVNSVMV